MAVFTIAAIAGALSSVGITSSFVASASCHPLKCQPKGKK